MHLTSVKN